MLLNYHQRNYIYIRKSSITYLTIALLVLPMIKKHSYFQFTGVCGT